MIASLASNREHPRSVVPAATLNSVINVPQGYQTDDSGPDGNTGQGESYLSADVLLLDVLASPPCQFTRVYQPRAQSCSHQRKANYIVPS